MRFLTRSSDTSFAGDSPPIANSIYHAAQFRVEKSFASNLQFLVTYTVSKSIDNASATDDSISWLGGGLNGNTLSVQDPYICARNDRSRLSTFPRFCSSATYTLCRLVAESASVATCTPS